MPVHKWEDDIKMDLKEVGWEGIDWTSSGTEWGQWLPLVNMVMNLQVK
jgi:hypothetical protein